MSNSAFRLNHRPALDGLRGISIILVLILHVNLLYPFPVTLLKGGFLGVDMFFVISGFLITSLLVEESERTGGISLRQFYLRRALRLAPALVAVLVFTLLLASIVGFAPLGLSPLRLASTVAYFTNWIRAFETLNQAWFLIHFWSLSIEEQFYLIWPVALILLLKCKRRTAILIVVGGIAVSWLLKGVLYASGASTMRIYHGSDTRADALLIGCLLSLALHWGYIPWMLRRPVFSRASWILFTISVVFVSRDDAILYFGGYTLLSLAAAIIILRSLFTPALVLTHPLLLWIGKRSYGLYIWHWPVYQIAKYFPAAYVVPIGVVGTFVAAAFSYRYIERPFLELKHRHLSQVSAPIPQQVVESSPRYHYAIR